MNSEKPNKSKPAVISKDFINIQDQYLRNIMDVRTSMKLDHGRSLSQGGHSTKMFRYFTLESLLLLVCLTASLLILPLVLPPLPPPPPFMLLLLPIFILTLLMLLAFMPSGVRELTHTYA